MYRADHIKYTLRFHRPAGTSRGTLRTKDSWIIRISNVNDPSRFGLGEVSLIPGLSPDDPDRIDGLLNDIAAALRTGTFSEKLQSGTVSEALRSGIVSETLRSGTNSADSPFSDQRSGPTSQPKKQLSEKETAVSAAGQKDTGSNSGSGSISGTDLSGFPAVRFGIETALRDLETGGNRVLYPSEFTRGTLGIPINGLIWMGNRRDMLQQISRKLAAGFRIIKLKVGALDFADELNVLEEVRTQFPAADLEIRLDANGAWAPGEALDKLNKLSEFAIHSLEQPIPAGTTEEMARICKASPIPVALDEELIGVSNSAEMKRLLEEIRPSYIILKPSLLGGITKSKEWIDLAETQGAGWWITSALESNIGLNAIAQWTATLDTDMPQGLGTGSLYENNIPSPLAVIQDRIHYLPGETWDISGLTFTR